jgi:chromosome partitioning protein
MEETINQAKAFNPDLKVYALLNAVSTNPQVNEAQEAAKLLEEFNEIQLLESILHARKVYGDSVIEGKGVIEMGNTKAKDEIINLLTEIL